MTTRPGFSVRGSRVTVVGAGRSGTAAAELLLRRGAMVTLTDTRPSVSGEQRLRDAGASLDLGTDGAVSMRMADLIVLSPGVPPRQPAIEGARAAGVPILGELELASRWLRGRIVAITGTKGKSTTTTLTGRMLEAAGHKVLVGGNIGNALSAQVEASTEDTIHVVEASSFQLESAETFAPWIAVLLNLSADHLDRHATLEEYGAAKARIFANQTAGDWAVLNADDPATLEIASRARARRLLISREGNLPDGVVVSGPYIVRRTAGAEEPLVPLSSIRLLGPHLVTDVVAAAAVASIADVSPEAMTRAVEGFTGLEHALEPVVDVGGIRFVNDSKATNVDAARRSVESFGPGLVAIMGGRFKGGDFATLRPALEARHATVVAIGEARPLLHEALDSSVTVRDAPDMRAAVRTAFCAAPAGGVVLLAPACSSFDMFLDYAERGRVFRQEALRLQEEWNGAREQ